MNHPMKISFPRVQHIKWKPHATLADVIFAEIDVAKLGGTIRTIPKVFPGYTWYSRIYWEH